MKKNGSHIFVTNLINREGSKLKNTLNVIVFEIYKSFIKSAKSNKINNHEYVTSGKQKA